MPDFTGMKPTLLPPRRIGAIVAAPAWPYFALIDDGLTLLDDGEADTDRV
jgi:hypothetical protein